jgi:drug/metabolite transporter (DMT)-like permease
VKRFIPLWENPIVIRSSVMKMLAISLVAGTAANLAIDGRFTFAAAQTLPAQSWLILLALATICTAIGYSIWFIVIRDCPVNVAALTVFAQSVFGVGLAAVWLRDPCTGANCWVVAPSCRPRSGPFTTTPLRICDLQFTICE